MSNTNPVKFISRGINPAWELAKYEEGYIIKGCSAAVPSTVRRSNSPKFEPESIIPKYIDTTETGAQHFSHF